MGRVFGMDGVKGIAVTELTCELAMQIGRAIAHLLKIEHHRRPNVLVGKDTRISSDILEAAMCAGLTSAGADVQKVGIVPAPAAAWLIKQYDCDAGVMLSAPRSNVECNGIRVFSPEGVPISEEQEEDIESLILDYPEHIQLADNEELGRITVCETALQTYLAYAENWVTERFDGMRIALDCSNGCTSHTAKQMFQALGAEVLLIHAEPDGRNINDGCGANHIEDLMNFVKEEHCDAGLAFDGDGTRCLAVDETGEMVDGDKLLAIFASDYQERKQLHYDAVVVTVMSNLGFTYFAREHGIRPITANAGERYILEKMQDGGYTLGGEQGGYVIFMDESPIGDGQKTGARLLEILRRSGKTMSELAKIMEKFPQVMVNVRIPVQQKENWKNDDTITALIDRHEQELGDAGRIMVRESNTDAMIRVMVEGKDFRQINAIAMEISDTIRERVGC